MYLKERFDLFKHEYLKFDRVEQGMSRPDLNAFVILDSLVPGDQGIVGCAEHDKIYLSIDCEALERVVSDDDIKTLVRCGVMYDDEYDFLIMFT